MRGFTSRIFVVVGALFLVYGCHTLAGVHTDGVLATGGGGGGGGGIGGGIGGGSAGGGGIGGGIGGGGGSAGGGGGGNCNPQDCLSKMCDKGACVPVNASCSPENVPFTIFDPIDFTMPDGKLLVSHSAKGVYVAIAEKTGPTAKFRARTIDGVTSNVSDITDCTIAASEATMVRSRASDTEFVLQGYQFPNTSAMTEVSFPLNPADGQLAGSCTSMPMVSWTACVNHMVASAFVRIGSVTKYAATCEDAADPNTYHLVTGGSDEVAYTEIASGPSTDDSLRVGGITYINNERVIFTAPDLYGKIGFRRESNGYTSTPIVLSSDPLRQSTLIGMVPEVEGQSAYFLLGSGLLPPKFDAILLGGLVTDVSQFASTPPTGMKLLGSFMGADVAKLGTASPLAKDDVSYSAAISPLSKKSADIYWIAKNGEVLVAGQSAYVVPPGDASLIPRSAFVPLGALFRLAVWREDNAGQLTVRAQKFICSY